MKHVKAAFKQHLAQWGAHLAAARGQDNPAAFLLAQQARTTLFYLQAMCRLLGQVHDKKKFGKLKERFKLMEDALGAVDYQQGLLRDFADNPQIPAAVLDVVERDHAAALAQTNELLIQQGWLGKKAQRMDKVKQLCRQIDWLSDAQFNAVLRPFYQSQIDALTEQLSQPLVEIEAGVHELRRDLRWLSIYPQAFKGFVTLKPARGTAAKWSKYLTPKIIASPFNQLPRVADIEPIELNANPFYALSWLIDALGTLKDQGLRVQALTQCLNDETQAIATLGAGQASPSEILTAAQIVAAQVKKDGVLSNLLATRRQPSGHSV
ncbi:MAG: hypothetical protein ACRCV6_10285 [Formosimonas sp.]